MSCARFETVDLAAFAAEPASAGDAFRDHLAGCGVCTAAVHPWLQLQRTLGGIDGVGRAGSAHPAPPRLAAWQAGAPDLPNAERAAIVRHLAGCGRCRSERALLDDAFLAALVREAGAAGAEQAAVEHPLRDALARVLGALARPAPALAFASIVGGVVAGLWWVGGVAPLAPARPASRHAVAPAPTRAPAAEQLAQAPAASPAAAVPQPPEAGLQPTPSQVARAPDPTPVGARAAAAPAPVPAPERDIPAPCRAAPAMPAPDALQPAAPFEIAMQVPQAPPHYLPPAGLGPDAASGRTSTVVRSGGASLPVVQVLAPPHTARTLDASPVLYWRLSAQSPVPVELVLIADDAVEPLLERRVDPPVAAGLHALSLADAGIALRPDVAHQWSVALVPDPQRRDQDRVAMAGLRFAPPDVALRDALARAPAAERAHRLAAAGDWLGAFATLEAWRRAAPDAPRLRAHRDALLAQAGLDAPAP